MYCEVIFDKVKLVALKGQSFPWSDRKNILIPKERAYPHVDQDCLVNLQPRGDVAKSDKIK